MNPTTIARRVAGTTVALAALVFTSASPAAPGIAATIGLLPG